MRKTRVILTIALVICAFAVGATTLAVITVNHNMTSTGAITTTPNIGVYSDSTCTQTLNSVNWDSVSAGSSVTQTIYVKNTGTGAMTLSMATTNWTPPSSTSYLTITWNKQNVQLSAGQSVAAILTLTVAANITDITSFSNHITISGTA